MADTINTLINGIENSKGDIADAIENKGVTVPSGTKLSGMARLIGQIPIMHGPESSTDGNLAAFDGTGGDTLKDSGIGMANVVTSVNNISPTNGNVTISIPTVNNGTLTIQGNGTTASTFTANQSGNTTLNFKGSGGTTVTKTANNEITISTSDLGAKIIELEDNGSTTAGTWLAKTDQISALASGQIFLYKITVAGASTTKLNITGSGGTAFGAKNVYRYGTTKLTTQYPVGSYLLLYYNGTYFFVFNDYDANSYAYVRQYQEGTNAAGSGTHYPILTRYNLTNKHGSYDTAYTRYHTDTYIDTSNGYLYAPKLYSNGNEVYTKPSTGIPASDLAETYYLASNPNGYTSNTGTITGVSVNGSSVATSGVANITSIPWSIVANKPTIPATNVIPTTTTANKILLSTATSGTAKWSDWSSAGFLKTNASGVVSVDTNTYLTTSGKAADSDKLDGNDSSYFQKALPTTSTAGKVLKSTSTAGTVEWGDDNNTNYYPSRSYSSGLQISTSQGVANTCALYVPEATTTQSGVITTGDQTFAGNKTFTGTIYTSYSSGMNHGYIYSSNNVMYVHTTTGEITIDACTDVNIYSDTTGNVNIQDGRIIVPASVTTGTTQITFKDFNRETPTSTTTYTPTYTFPKLLNNDSHVIAITEDIPTKTSDLTNDSGFVTSDTKNTAGSTNDTSLLYLIGAKTQAANPQTYSRNNTYINANGVLVNTTGFSSQSGGSSTYALLNVGSSTLSYSSGSGPASFYANSPTHGSFKFGEETNGIYLQKVSGPSCAGDGYLLFPNVGTSSSPKTIATTEDVPTNLQNGSGTNSLQQKGTTAGYDSQTTLGTYNNNKSDTLLEVGNGSSGNPSNALEVYADGHVEVGTESVIGADIFTITVTSSGSYPVDHDSYGVTDLPVSKFEALYNYINNNGSKTVSESSSYSSTIISVSWTATTRTFDGVTYNAINCNAGGPGYYLYKYSDTEVRMSSAAVSLMTALTVYKAGTDSGVMNILSPSNTMGVVTVGQFVNILDSRGYTTASEVNNYRYKHTVRVYLANKIQLRCEYIISKTQSSDYASVAPNSQVYLARALYYAGATSQNIAVPATGMVYVNANTTGIVTGIYSTGTVGSNIYICYLPIVTSSGSDATIAVNVPSESTVQLISLGSPTTYGYAKAV